MNWGKHGAIYKQLLEGNEKNKVAPLSIDLVKKGITHLISQKKKSVMEAGYPPQYVEGYINGVLLEENKSQELEVSL